MEEKTINCYFCGKKAIQIVESVNARNVRIRCEHCEVYELSDYVLQFHYDENLNCVCYSDEYTGEEKELPQDIKDKLSEYVRSNFNTDTGDPVLITMNKFRDITGKSSVHRI